MLMQISILRGDIHRSKISILRAREMALWLRVVTVLLEDPGSILSTHMAAQTPLCNSIARESDICKQTRMQAKISMHIK